MKSLLSSIAILIISVFAVAPYTAAESDGGAPIGTTLGAVRGVDMGAVDVFLGIPYAAPPVGDLRWKPPQPAQPWDDVLDASTFGNSCPQSTPGKHSEDCLYLNVFAPEAKGPHPVLIWIHGGNLEVGSGNVDFSELAKRGIVVVTINYRLGHLGFLAHPALSAESPYRESGNYGLMDQQAAFNWVQRNIANFGGDPGRVTIGGQSAGATSTLSHIVSPTAVGLFDKAIVHSGGYGLDISTRVVQPVRQMSLAQAEAKGKIIARNVGCPDQTAQCLRQVPAKTLVKHVNDGKRNRWPMPNTETRIVPRSIGDALVAGRIVNRVPVLIGTTHDEHESRVASLLSAMGERLSLRDNYLEALQSVIPGRTARGLKISPAQAQIVADEYPLDEYKAPIFAWVAALSDGIWVCNARTQAQLLSRHVPTYLWEFDDPNAPVPSWQVPESELPRWSDFHYRASHTSESPYLWASPDENPELTADQKKLSETMLTYWAHFIRTGDPNPPSSQKVPFWPLYRRYSSIVMSLEPPTPQAITNFAQDHHCGFWNRFLATGS